MISDVLSDALGEIVTYLDWEPCPYDAEQVRMINALQDHMRRVMNDLDTPPFEAEQAGNGGAGTGGERENRS